MFKITSLRVAGFTIAPIALALSLSTGCSKSSTPEKTIVSGVDLTAVDNKVRPQDDFFDYVNGTWLKNLTIPADKSSYGAFTKLRDKSEKDVKEIVLTIAKQSSSADEKKVADLYGSFMDQASIKAKGLAPYQSMVEPISQIKDITTLIAHMASTEYYGASPLGHFVNIDKADPNRYTVYLYQSGLSLPDRSYYFDESEKGKKLLQQFELHIKNMFELAGEPNAKALAKQVVSIETQLAKGHWERVELRDAVKTYNPKDLTGLQEMAPNFPWNAYLKAAGVDAEKQWVAYTPSYFSYLDDVIGKVSLADWKTYAKWHTLHSLAPYLTSEIDAENFDFFSAKLNGTKEQSERWKRALRIVNEQLGEVIGKLYVAKHFPPEAKERMEALVENLRTAYGQGIKELAWMSDETKQQALDKLYKFNPKIGYPNKWKDYSGMKLQPNDLVGNVLAANNFHYQEQLKKLGKPIDREEWAMNPQTVNAYYNPLMNEIVFPAAILQPPFFNLEADDAVNYGAIGAVIGHEMGHGFDDQGSRYNGDGELKNWWQPEDLEAFKSRTAKLVEQFNSFEALDGLFVNGQLTLGENIGDLGGLTIAYKAYQLSLDGQSSPIIDELSGEQRFFFGWAQAFAGKYRDEALANRIKTDPHSPYRFRVNGPLRNMPEFILAYDVKEGDGMFLPQEDRVKIW